MSKILVNIEKVYLWAIFLVFWLLFELTSALLMALGLNGCTKCDGYPPTFEEVVDNNIGWFIVDFIITIGALNILILMTSKRTQNKKIIQTKWILVILFFVHIVSGWSIYVYERMRCYKDCYDVPYHPVFDTIVTATWIVSLPLIVATLLISLLKPELLSIPTRQR